MKNVHDIYLNIRNTFRILCIINFITNKMKMWRVVLSQREITIICNYSSKKFRSYLLTIFKDVWPDTCI